MATLGAWLSAVRHVHTSIAKRHQLPINLKCRKPSSQQWLLRQMTDPYVEKAKMENYRCRSAFKLLEINKRSNILLPGMIVVDCGAAPGSWTQVAVNLTNANGKTLDKPVGTVVAIDKSQLYPIDGGIVVGNMDFTLPESQEKLKMHLGGRSVDVVLSDMAPSATGVKRMDHEKIMSLAYSAFKFALDVSKVNGTFLVKLWDGRDARLIEEDLRKFYTSVKVYRPMATRTESSEKFMLAKGFKGLRV